LNRGVSYPEAFDGNDESRSAEVTEDVPFPVEPAKVADGQAVELAVGDTGRPAKLVLIARKPS
jgi:hypothetical protein